jgi:hypothetical protein
LRKGSGSIVYQPSSLEKKRRSEIPSGGTTLHDDSLFSQIVRNVVWHLADPDSRTKKRKHERSSGIPNRLKLSAVHGGPGAAGQFAQADHADGDLA